MAQNLPEIGRLPHLDVKMDKKFSEIGKVGLHSFSNTLIKIFKDIILSKERYRLFCHYFTFRNQYCALKEIYILFVVCPGKHYLFIFRQILIMILALKVLQNSLTHQSLKLDWIVPA